MADMSRGEARGHAPLCPPYGDRAGVEIILHFGGRTGVVGEVRRGGRLIGGLDGVSVRAVLDEADDLIGSEVAR